MCTDKSSLGAGANNQVMSEMCEAAQTGETGILEMYAKQGETLSWGCMIQQKTEKGIEQYK